MAIITNDNLDYFAHTNADLLKGKEISGIRFHIFGMNFNEMYNGPTRLGSQAAQLGVLLVFPYLNPWHWMSDTAIKECDEILDVIRDRYGRDLPICISGDSMGACGSLVYTHYSKHQDKIVSCVPNCPVCDLTYHFYERRDLPRAILSAFGPDNLEEKLKAHSPLFLVDTMPKHVEYHIFHCSDDQAVNMEKHSVRFVKAMEEKGFNITFDIAEGCGHCQLPGDMLNKFYRYTKDTLEAARLKMGKTFIIE